MIKKGEAQRDGKINRQRESMRFRQRMKDRKTERQNSVD